MSTVVSIIPYEAHLVPTKTNGIDFKQTHLLFPRLSTFRVLFHAYIKQEYLNGI